MTIIDDRPEVTWVEIPEEHRTERCIQAGCRRRAKVALYVPQCGRHPVCRRCARQLRRYFARFFTYLHMFGSNLPFTVTCYAHDTERSYRHDPFIFEG